jgi:hypothetical protein
MGKLGINSKMYPYIMCMWSGKHRACLPSQGRKSYCVVIGKAYCVNACIRIHAIEGKQIWAYLKSITNTKPTLAKL